MRTKLFIVTSLLLISSVNICASDYSRSLISVYYTKGTPKDNLSKKKYYQDVFSKKERRELKKAEKYIALSKKHNKIYEKNIRVIHRLEKVLERSKSAKTKKKTSRKINKLRKKAYKSAYKSIDSYKRAIAIQRRIYDLAINRLRLDDGSENARYGRQFEMQAEDVFREVENLENLASDKNDDEEKIKALIDANERASYAIMLKGLAISNYKNDTSGNNFLNKTDSVEKTTPEQAEKIEKITSEKDQSYDPEKDNNLYRSRANLIIPKLNMSNADLELLRTAKEEQSRANLLSDQVDNLYLSIDSLHIAAERPENEFEREQIHSKAAYKEMTAFAKLIQATKLYTSVNKKRYKIYDKYLYQLRRSKTQAKLAEASKYETSAAMFFQRAENDIAVSKRLMSKPEQYIQLMSANELMLQSIQFQEEAFAIYLDVQQRGSIEQIKNSYQPDNDQINNSTQSEETVAKSSNLTWNFQSRNVYSKAKPKAVRYKDKQGIIFTVQPGIFKGILPPSKFGRVQPIIFDKFEDNPYRRFMVGEYRTTEAVELALKKVKRLGYTDSYIVALENGIRKSYSKAKLRVNKNSAQYKKWKQAELARLNVKKPVYTKTYAGNTGSDKYFTDTDDVTKTRGLIYFVQLGMFSKTISPKEQFPGLEPILYEKIAGKGRRYMLGTFGLYSIAKQEAAKMKSRGYNSAFVTAYNNGNHISLDRARKIEKEQYADMQKPYNSSKGKSVQQGNIKFAVQVGAYSRKMSSAQVSNLKRSFGSRAINRKLMGGKHVYYIGNYDNYKSAKFLKKKLKNEGHSGVFVIAFRNNTKIPLSQVRK